MPGEESMDGFDGPESDGVDADRLPSGTTAARQRVGRCDRHRSSTVLSVEPAAEPHVEHRRPELVEGRAAVALSLPARFGRVRLARLVASGVGAEMGLDVVAIEDLRLVVDEACSVLLECCVTPGHRHHGDNLTVEFVRQTPRPDGRHDQRRTGEPCHDQRRPGESRLGIRVQRDGAAIATAPSLVSIAVLDATCVAWRLHDVLARIDIVMPDVAPPDDPAPGDVDTR